MDTFGNALLEVARLVLEDAMGPRHFSGTLHLKESRENGPLQYFQEDWHSMEVTESKMAEWRMKDRLKTLHAILSMCLNIGVDPPDMIKVSTLGQT